MKRSTFFCLLAAVFGLLALFASGCASERRYARSEGSLLSLEEAYADGCLSEGDLQNIAYYYHTRFGESALAGAFIPAPKTPPTLAEETICRIKRTRSPCSFRGRGLAEETICRIKRTYLDEVAGVPDGSFDRVYIVGYFGSYGGCAAVGLRSDYIVVDPLLYPEYTIGGVSFYDYDPSAVSIWRPDALEQ